VLEIPVYNTEGEPIKTMKVDEGLFGGRVNTAVLKQVIVAYHANRRRGTATTKSRGQIVGSTRKIHRQKGTGLARRGAVGSNIVRGGGVAFAKSTRDFRKAMPKKMRRAALNSAILAKMLGSDLMVIDGLKVDSPKAKQMAGLLEKLKINRTCLLTLADRDRNIYLSCRNIPHLTVCVAGQLNAFDVVTRQKMVVTTEAFEVLTRGEAAS